MHCGRCGRLNRQDAAFCDACGAELAPSDGEAPAGAAAPEATDGVPPPSVPSRTPQRLDDGVFVGRQAEMGVLQAALEDALAGGGRLVMLVGDPGIGKTRTAREFLAHAGRHGALGLWGRCHESHGAPPYWPWVQIIRGYVRERDDAQVRAAMGAEAPDIAAIAPDVRKRLSDLPIPPRFEDPEQARFRLFDAVTTFLQRAAHDQPLVLVLDNLHWADKSSLLLLEFLAQELGRARLLVIGTYRDVEVSRRHPLSETLGELTREHPLPRVMLGGLGREDVRCFIEAATGITPPPALVDAVHTQTGGNPLFLTEVIRLLTQEGELAPERMQRHQRASLGIPEGVRQAIGRRLNRLSPPCNRALTFFEADGRDAADKAIACAASAGTRALSLLAYEEAVHHYERALQALEGKAMPDQVQRFKLLVALGEAQRKAGDVPQAMATFQRAADLARCLGLPQDLAQAALGFEETTWRPGLPGDVAVQVA